MLVKSRNLCKLYIVLGYSGSELLQNLMKPMMINNTKEIIEIAVGYFSNKIDKKIILPPVKNEVGIFKKIVNLFTENVANQITSLKLQSEHHFLQ